MNATISAVRAGRRALALSALAAACLATTLGLTTDQAAAAYTARVKAGTLTISGDAAARRRSDGDGGSRSPAGPDPAACDAGCVNNPAAPGATEN